MGGMPPPIPTPATRALLVNASADVPAPPQDTDPHAPARTARPLNDAHLGLVRQFDAPLLEKTPRILPRAFRVLFELGQRVLEPRTIHSTLDRAVKTVDCIFALLAIFRATWTSH
jgi:hypothetical protein